jgi:hypothetical protein
MLDHCGQYAAALHTAGNTFARNIFSWNSTRPDSAVFGTPGPPNGPPCVWVPQRVSVSDYNLYHNSQLDMMTAGLFPGGLTLAAWQKGNKSKATGLPAAVQGTEEPPFEFPPRDVRACCLFLTRHCHAWCMYLLLPDVTRVVH